jgi:flagellar M-ring protein FliF
VHLVSSSVPDLLVKNVTVIDQNGNLLSAQNDSPPQTGLDPGQLKYVKTMEQDFAQRIESIVLPVVGNDNVHAQVTADIDFSQTEQAEEVYRPNQGAAAAAIRSQTSGESSSGAGGAQNGGVPGALSNQPPAPASAPINGKPAAAGAAAPAAPPASSISINKNSAVNYEVDKSLKHIRHSTGNIKRLSVAVVVNYRKLTAKDGKVSYKPRSEDDMAQINKLVREAMGYTETRGDTVTVANTAFTVAEAEAVEAVPFWKQPGMWALVQEIVKNLLIAGLVLFLFFKVLRPMFRSAMTPPPVDSQALSAGTAPGVMGAASYQSNLDSAKQLARQEPKLVANIVRSWVGGNER